MSGAAHSPSQIPTRVVFWAAVSLIFVFVTGTVIATETMEATFSWLQTEIVGNFGWFYILSMAGFLVFVSAVALSPMGRIRLGPDDSRPEFSRPTWFAMLFSAGMGIGLMFFSVAEPITHYVAPPFGRPGSMDAARNAMGLTFFHWGLHPWAVYAVVGLSLAYFCYRQRLPLSIRSVFYPLLGERIHGPLGDTVDVLAIVSTMFGVATSLGLGAMQVGAGLNYTLGVPDTLLSWTIIICVITAIATVSVVTGLKAGVRRLSELNMGLAILLLCFLFLVGPTAFLLNAFVENLGNYLQHLPVNSFWTATFEEPERQAWLSDWTVFYWAWWIAWSPFVGMFIARISRGRTIREFIVAVFLGPPAAGFIWLTVFGDTALHVQVFGDGGLAAAVEDSPAKALFILLQQFPLASITTVLATLCIVLFFVTSSDSASLVIDTIATGGELYSPVSHRIFWAVTEGGVAIVLLYAGGLEALQTAAITTALPFTVIIILMCVSLLRALRAELAEPVNGQPPLSKAVPVTPQPVAATLGSSGSQEPAGKSADR